MPAPMPSGQCLAITLKGQKEAVHPHHDTADVEVGHTCFSLRVFRFFLKSERCHLGSQRSGWGMGPGLAGSKSLGWRTFRLRFFLPCGCPLCSLFRAASSAARRLATQLPAAPSAQLSSC